MNHKMLKFGYVFLIIFGALNLIMAEGHKKDTNKGAMLKPTGEPQVYKININKISTWIYGDGRSDIRGGKSGFIYPKGSNRACFYQSGFVWGGKVNGEIRVGGTVYRTGLVNGVILPGGTAENPSAPENRMFRVRRDWKTGDLTAEVKTDNEGTEEQVRAQYEKDWNEWPAAKGAPYEDVNKDGKYNPADDIPGFPGADQTIWYATNDLDASASQYLYGSMPMGIEVQTTIWGYASTGALGNMIFRSYKMINKSNTDFTDMYVSMWSDPDNGSADDDLAGCDTTLSLGYIYNGKAKDDVYGYTPPAAGFDFFQGPAVPGAAEDQAIVDVVHKRKITGKKNLGITAFYYFINSDPTYTDPEQGVYQTGTLQMYNLLLGKIGTTGEYFPIPDRLGGGFTKFPLSGDPLTGRGYLDGMLFSAGDRRIGMASGPFIMAKGDTQEVVVAQIAAGNETGIDRLGAVGLLKFYDQQAQLAYNNFFDLPTPPPAPNVKVTELDKEIVISWGEDLNSIARTENFSSKGYAFEGYNVYQLPTASSSFSEAKLVANFDLVNGVGKIIGPEFDPSSGVVTDKVLQFGSDAGISRYLSITKDATNSNLPLVNGKRYYFAVTAYSYTPDPLAIPNNFENPLTVLTGSDGKIGVVPQSVNPGVRYESAFGDTVKTVVHSKGTSDGLVTPIVVDPTKTTGLEYKVTFEKIGDTLDVWHLDRSDGVRVLTNQTNQNSDMLSPLVDGMQIRVSGAPYGFKDFLTMANANGPLNPPDYAAFAFNSSGFPHPSLPDVDRPSDNQQVGPATYGIHTGFVDGEDPTFTFFTNRVTQNGARWPFIIGKDFEIRFTAAGGKAFAPNAFTTGADAGGVLMDVPFELWNIGNPNDPADDIRYFPYLIDSDTNNVFSFSGDHNISGGNNDPETDWIYWVRPEDETPGQNGYNALVAKIQANPAAYTYMDGTNGDALRRMVIINFNGGVAPALNQAMPETGTIFRIVTNKPNTAGKDEFTFTAPKVEASTTLAKEDVERINIFPNPYYGANPEELNKYQRFVTISHLPRKAIIRIFNLAGQLIQTIRKDSPEQFQRWDLANQSGLPVASGLYIIHVDMPDLGKTKIIKAAIIQEQQILDHF
ncbi:MAG: T9SS type A sorting domain-containing protein [Bacteroidota bacterium]